MNLSDFKRPKSECKDKSVCGQLGGGHGSWQPVRNELLRTYRMWFVLKLMAEVLIGLCM